jgi:phosphatidate cytidylyltransferase
MLERSISGSVFVAVVLASIYFGPFSLWLFMTIVALGGLWEYQKLLFDTSSPVFQPRRWSQLILAVLMLICWFLYLDDDFRNIQFGVFQPLNYLVILAALAIITVWVGMSLELFSKETQPFKEFSLWLFGFIYVVIPVALYSQLSMTANATYQPIVALAPFLLIWTNDTMAYLSGRAIGKTPFFPRISPKKTWEGTIGGAICTLVLAYFFGPKLGGWDQNQWLIAAAVVAVFGTIGDLVESMLKRSVGVKDSGNIMPGHGGFLDRFDSFIFAAPFLWLLLRLA